MTTFFELIQEDGFRSFVSRRIADGTQTAYSFSPVLPPLYKYRSLSTFAVDDILNNKITLTSIGEFNDIFDGAIHQYGTMEEIERAAEANWAKMEAHRVAAHFPDGLLQRDSIVEPYIEHLKTESRLKFRQLDYLGTYVCCFSEDNGSTLMWAHYADLNKGICIEYDFNKLPSANGNLLRKSIFPVAYTPKPIDVADLLTDSGNQIIYQYALDAAVLCTALNKASMWNYEREWRIVWVLPSSSEYDQRLTINSLIKPSKIYFGYHFLKPFFYYNYKNQSEYKKCTEIVKQVIALTAFMQKQSIKAAVMVPLIGSYQIKPHDISVSELYGFVLQHFHDEQPQSMRYYYTVHDCLMDIIELTQEAVHV